MTDLDSTEILSADESLLQNSSTIDSEASLKILSGTDPNTFQINKETIIGRSTPSDAIIAAPSLSKQHAKITINNGQYFLTDLGSSNKTFHNKVQLQPNVCYAIHNGDEIKFGDIICTFQEQNNVKETNVSAIPTTQTITDSYDNQELTQPMKVWNGNGNDTNHHIDQTPKQNGVNESPNKSSSSFVPHPSSTTTNDDDDDDNSLLIGSTTLPATVPLLVESKQLNNDDQLEIISSPQTKRIIPNETTPVVKMEDTPSPPANEPTTTTTDNLPSDSLVAEAPQPATMETSAPAVCADRDITKPAEEMDNSSPRPASEQLDVLPMSKLAEQLQDIDNITDDVTPKQQVEVTINQELVKEASTSEQMDTDQTTESPSMTIDDKSTTVTDEQQENVNKMEDEVVSVTNSDVMTVDETEKTNEEVSATTMEQETALELNKSITAPETEPEKKIDEHTAVVAPEEVPSSTPDVEQEPEEEEEETEETAPVSGRGHRGVARRNVRRAHGRRGAATRARVVSTRIHGGRRNPIVAPTIDNGGNNTTLEETVSTEAEESPKKSISTPEVEKNKSNENKTVVTPSQDTTSASQTNTGSNVRVSARIKQRVSTGRNRQFPYTDDYVDLDDLEKQSKAAHATSTAAAAAAAAAAATTTTTTTAGRQSKRGRASSSPQKRISLRQQPIDAAESLDQKETTDVYEQMETASENKEPTPKTGGRKRKSTTPVASVTNKRNRPTTPQTAPTMTTRRKQTSTAEPSPTSSPTVAKSGRRTVAEQPPQQPTTTTPAPSTPTTPKRGRKSTKVNTPTEQSPEKQNAPIDRPVRIALSSHLNFDQNHLEILRKLGFEIMDESCQVDALVVDRIRRTKKFFMCLARGAHILSPSWIEAMIKENRYISYDKYYLEDTNAETRYGFKLRESVQLAKQGPIFKIYKFFCTADTSPPYDDIKDIIEAAGGKLLDKINPNKPGKDLICIVGQIHKNEYEDLFKKGVPIVSEEFVLSGISKQKLDFEAFSLFQNATTIKPTGSK